MKHSALWFVVLLCTLSLCFVGVGLTEGVPEAQELALDTSCDVTVSAGQETYVCFTAESDGIYRFSSGSGNTVQITCCTILNGEINALFSGVDELVMPLYAGESRYCGLRFAEDYAGSIPFTVNQLGSLTVLNANEETMAVVGENGYSYFVFTPAQTGRYEFYSMADEDTFGYCYTVSDGLMNEIASDDEGGGNGNFLLTVSANAGETLYFGARYYGGQSGSFPVMIQSYNGLVSYVVGEQSVYQVYGQSSTLTVEASSGRGDVTWTWLLREDGLNYPVDGADGNSITVPADITEVAQYCCRVSDGTDEQQYDFTVYPTDEFTEIHAQDEIYDISIPLGDSADLTVVAVTASNLHTYQWYQEKTEGEGEEQFVCLEPVSGAVNNTYHVEGIEKNTKYICRVTSPVNSILQDVEFYVSVSCDMTVTADSDQNIVVAAGGSAEMRVFAETASNLVTYQWYKANNYGGWERIDGAKSDTYIATDIQRNSHFQCSVDNGYGVSESIEFTVSLENNVCAWAANDVLYYVTLGCDCTLEVGASSDNDISEFAYQWYGPSFTENGTAEAIAGATENTLTVSNVQHNGYYYCIVTDQFAFCDRIDFHVFVENYLSAEPAADQWQYITIGEFTELSVNASSASEVSYQWYGPIPENGNEEDAPIIDGANSSSYEVTQWTSSNDTYLCIVSDPYGNTVTVPFHVDIASNLEVYARNGNSWVTVGYNEPAEFAVDAYSSGEVTYQWYAFVDINEYLSGWRMLPGEERDTLTIENVTEPAQYRCKVTDQIGKEVSADFGVQIDNGLQVYCDNQYCSTNANESVTLSVTASCIGGEISYQWYAEVRDNYGGSAYRAIEGETASTLVVSDHEFNGRYFYCLVTDETGDSKESEYFNIWVENGFSAEAVEPTLTVAPGGSTTMTVNTTSYDGEIFYIWYQDNTEIPDATGSSYTIESAVSCANYRCHVHDRYNNDTNVFFTVNIDNGFTASAVEDYLAAVPGQTAVMTVNASCNDGPISYQWYKYDDWYGGMLIEDATSEAYTSDAITAYTQYYCKVKDQYGNITDVWFYISIENHFTATAVQSELRAEPNNTATMEVSASCDSGKLTYQWYKNDPYYDEYENWHEYRQVEGAAGATLTSDPITKYTLYFCIVSDEYGNSSQVSFEVSVENHLTATAVQDNYTVAPNETVTMEVNAVCDVGTLTYQWYKEGYTDAAGNWHDSELIEGATGSTYISEAITRSTGYSCTIRDEYGNSANAWFYISIENHFTATAVQSELRAEPNSTATMEVSASCDSGKLTYQWYKNDPYYDEYDNWHEYRQVEGAAGATLTSDPITKYTQYYCAVRDEYGNNTTVDFYVSVENYFTAEAEENSLRVAPNTSATMTVQASCDTGDILYQWRQFGIEVDEWGNECEAWIPIEGATEATYTTGAITGNTQYSCYVRDEYGATADVWFGVSVENHLTAEGTQSAYIVAPNGSVTMEVNAVCDSGTLTYQWYKEGYTDVEGNWHEGELIEGETGSTYTSEPITRHTGYYCIVRDEYGNSTDVWFNMSVENHFTATAVQSVLKAEPNSTATMEVSASCDSGKLTYQWYKNEPYYDEYDNWHEYRQVEGAAGTTLTSDPVTEYTRYYCVVGDEYGNRTNVDFYVSVENHFTATAVQDNYTVAPNETVTMEVNAVCDAGTLSCQWYKEGYTDAEGAWHETELIEDEKGLTYTSEVITRYTGYFCTVCDEYGNSTDVWFHISVENHFTAGAVQSELKAEPNNTATMEVSAICDSGELTYQWYKYESYYDENGNFHETRRVDGATEATLTSDPITKYTQYYCAVRDEYGNNTTVDFYVSVENHFTAEAVQNNYAVAPNETVTMEVNAVCDVGTLTYAWYKNEYTDEEGIWHQAELLEGITDSVCTSEAITRRTGYYCTVRDEYGNNTSVWFHISVENHFTVTAVQSELKAEPNSTATMEVSASCDSGDLTYQWYKYDPYYDEYDNWHEYRQVEGAAGATLTSDPITEYTQYYCDVRDEYGNNTSVWFYISVENHFTAGAVQSELKAEPNNTATMEVSAICDSGDLTYQWYKYESYYDENGNFHETRRVDGATGAILTSDPITKYTRYYCIVGDEYGNNTTVDFYVSVENHFTAAAVQDMLTVVPNASVTMEVNASCDVGNLTYQWYKTDPYYDEEGNWHEHRELNGATDASYTSEAITGYTPYYCHVQDEYGNSNFIGFFVYLENHFTATAVQSALIAVPNSTAAMEVSASCDSGELTYQWYKYDPYYDEYDNWYEYRQVEGATGATLTSDPITGHTRYYCDVRDEYGNRIDVVFSVNVENHFTAEAVQDNYTVAPNETVTMEVNAFCDVGTLTYAWYKDEYTDEEGIWHQAELLEGITDSVCTSEAITRRTGYYCTVRDEYGNYYNVWFYVSVENHFRARGNDSDLNVVLNEPVTMEVYASCDAGPLSYQWYKYDPYMNENRKIEGATEASYISEAITEFTLFYCEVWDVYENRAGFWFNLCLHENVEDIVDVSYTEYEWISNTQHMAITVVTSHKQCNQCGHTEPSVTTVTEGEAEEHTDEDGNGICDICGQNIEGSFLWDVNSGVLRITGNGAIPDFEQVSDLPWYNDLERIERVFIEGNFTAIGKNVLNGLRSETRIDFRQRKMPTVDTATICGVCRYYSADESWKNAPENWIYLPIFNPDWESVIQVEYHEGTGWETGRYNATGDVSYPLTAKQAVELAYTGRNVKLYGIPAGDDLKVITDHWDTTWSVHFEDGCAGTMNLEIGSNAHYGLDFDVRAPGLTVNIDASNVESINRILVSAGNVTFTGRLRDVILRAGDSNESNLTVNGDVDELDFYDRTSDAPYYGSLTVNGTIASGSVYGSATISVPHISDEVVFPNMVKAGLTNVEQTTPVVTNGVLTVNGVQYISGLTYEDFDLRYHLMSDGWRLDLMPRQDSAYGAYGASIDDVEAYNPEFSTDDILWSETTEVYVFDVRNLGKLVFNGGENGEGLKELTLHSCIAEVNCPVTALRVNQSYTDPDAVTVTIKGEITTLAMEMRKNGNTVYLGEGGSVGGGYWNRYFGENRYFGPITEAGDIYSEGQLKVLSWKDGQSIRALLPSDTTVTEAAGQAATIDLNEVTENALSDGEYNKLQEYLQSQGIGTVAGVFDVSVMGVDANGDIQEGVKISTLNNDVPLTVSNEANGEAYILRLHENDDGTVSADQLCEATDNMELRFASSLFSKYVIIDANGMPETGEVSWQIAKQRLIISGSGPMDDYEKPEDAPWYEQREGIKEIILDSGITRVGDNAFCDMTGTVRVDFNQRVLPSIGENAFGSSNVICRYYREHDSWTGTYGANSIKWVYLPINNQGSDYENIRYYKDSETFGTGWTIYSQETGEIAVTTEQAEEFSFLGRAVYLYAMPENQTDLDIFEQHWDIMHNLYFFPEGSGTYNITLPETAHPLALDFDAPGWTLNIEATACGEDAFGMILAGGGTLNVTAQNVSTLFLGSSNVYADPMPSGTVVVHGDVETLNFYNRDNSERRFSGNATVYGTVRNGYEYGMATAVIPNIPNITAPQMIVSKFENVNQTAPIVLNSALNVADVESYGVYTTDNSWLFYQLYDNEGKDEWKLQISPRTNDNSQPVFIEIADYNPDFTMDDICWGEYTGLVLMKARPGQTVVINGAEGKGLNNIDVTETNVEVNCPVYQMGIGDWSRNGNNFQVTVNNTINALYLNLHWKQCSILLGENAKINGGYLQQPFHEDLFFEDVHGSGVMMQNSRLMILSHQLGQQISTLLPDEEMLTSKAGLEEGQIAVMEATDADGLTEAEEAAFARADIQGTAAEAFDVSVAVYEVDEEGNAGGRIGTVTTLNGKVPIMVKNVTGEEAFVVRLHEDENGEITAEAVMEEASDASVFTFYSDLFSKYVLVKAEAPIDLSTLTTLQLPAGLIQIEDNAFEGGAFQAVIIPDGCVSIGVDAFKDCPNLIYVSYPAGITGIEDAFSGCNIRKMDERE